MTFLISATNKSKLSHAGELLSHNADAHASALPLTGEGTVAGGEALVWETSKSLGIHLRDPCRETLESLHRSIAPEGLAVFHDQGALGGESSAKGVHVRWVHFGQIILLWGAIAAGPKSRHRGRTGVCFNHLLIQVEDSCSSKDDRESAGKWQDAQRHNISNAQSQTFIAWNNLLLITPSKSPKICLCR